MARPQGNEGGMGRGNQNRGGQGELYNHFSVIEFIINSKISKRTAKFISHSVIKTFYLGGRGII